MKRMPAQAELPKPVTVECTYCGVEMTEHSAAASRVRYFRCRSCRRCFSSVYAEIFTADAKVRMVGGKPACAADDFAEVKQRLEHWLRQLDSQDPYRVLGLSRQDTLESIKSRYRELALQLHPDRGGSLESMKELNLAYGRLAKRKNQSQPDSADKSSPGSRPLRRR